MGFARGSSDAVVFLAGGKVIESGPAEEIFGEPKSETVRAFFGKVMKW